MADLLRICTAGSVDDGKSTLIGRLLFDAHAIYEDQVHAVERASRSRDAGAIDFSLFTDGLKAEREQGITIDVAYRYFATARRKFILADTPGHEQYTRNMATGASSAEVAILLVDARHGMRPQSKHHARIARLLGIRDFVIAVNKMDLVGFDQRVFATIAAGFGELLPSARTHAIPISALQGDNVTTASHRTPWYGGPSLLAHLETLEVRRDPGKGPFRQPVQLVLRTGDGFRGYAGQVVSGEVRVGDTVTVWPSGKSSRIARIVTRDGDLDAARAPMSVAVTLEDEIDAGRGDLLSIGAPHVGRRFDARIVWMDERPLDPHRLYLLKHTTRTVAAEVDRPFRLNEIGSATIVTSRPLMFDPYEEVRATGSFILIDPDSSFTAAAGMVVRPRDDRRARSDHVEAAERLAVLARRAATDGDATDAIRTALEELLR